MGRWLSTYVCWGVPVTCVNDDNYIFVSFFVFSCMYCKFFFLLKRLKLFYRIFQVLLNTKKWDNI